MEPRRLMASIVVNTTADTIDANAAVTSLREAITQANSQAGDDTITFNIGGLGFQTINLSSALPVLSTNISITGPSAKVLTVRRNTGGNYRIFEVSAGVTASVSGLTLTNGADVTSGGGAILSNGTLTLSNCVISGNTSTGQGAGIYNVGTLTINNSLISGNTAAGSAGAIGVYGGTVSVNNSTLTGNKAAIFGGAVDVNGGAITIRNSTIVSNVAQYTNGGLGNGGGISNFQSVTLFNTIVAGNSAKSGASAVSDDVNNNPVAAASSNNLIGNAATAGGLTNGVSGNIIGVGGVGIRPISTIVSTTLADNGGTTSTLALVSGSAAINAGANAQIPAGATSDQRGAPFVRTFGGTVDIGAYESQTLSLVVNQATDADDGNFTQLSLREAIKLANRNPGTDSISFNLGAGAQTINLVGALNDISTSMNITGPGASLLNIHRNTGGRYRIFNVLAGTTVNISGLTLSNGSPFTDDAQGGNLANGGGIQNAGTLTLTNSVISGNSAGSGGGIYNTGQLTITNTAISGNSAPTLSDGLDGSGGGIFNFNGSITMQSCTIDNNSALGSGGGLYNGATITLINTTIALNKVIDFDGGGIYTSGIITLANCTISDNAASTGGGNITRQAGTFTMKNTIIANNRGGGELASDGSDIIGSNNLVEGGPAPAGIPDTLTSDPMLAPLGNYGGLTQTMLLLPGSPAINKGSNANIPAGVTTDQRGKTRINTTTVDIGAVEFTPVTLTVTGTANVDTIIFNGDSYTLNGVVVPISPEANQVVFNTGAGNDTFFINKTLTGVTATFNGEADNDSYSILDWDGSFNRWEDFIQGAVVAQGGTGTNDAAVFDSDDNDTIYTITGNVISKGAAAKITVNQTQSFQFENIDPVAHTTVDATASTLAGATYLFRGAGVNSFYGGPQSETADGRDSGYNYFFGGGGNDTLIGGDGNDTFSGGAGSDSLVGGGAEDEYDFGAPVGSEVDTIVELIGGSDAGPHDVLEFSSDPSNLTINLNSTTIVTETGRVVKSGSGLPAEIEGVICGNGNNSVIGNYRNNTIRGGSGNDTITGGDGSDDIDGGNGQNTYLFGNAASIEDDTVGAGSGIDTLDFSAMTVPVTINLSSNTLATNSNRTVSTATAGAFVNFENAIGGSAADSITGNSGNNTLSGNSGNDTITGGEGSDSLVGGANDDTYKFTNATAAQTDRVNEAAGGGTDTLDFSAITNALTANLLSDTLATHTNRTVLTGVAGQFANIENVSGGSAGDSITGNASNNTLTGNAGNDTLTGGDGSDSLVGGANDDTYKFATAAAAQTDRVNEAAGGGTDTLDFSALATSVTVNLSSDTMATHTNRTVLTGVAGQFANIENAIGGSAADSLTGNALANTLTGNAGNDTLTGGEGSDSLVGGANDDTYKFANATNVQTDRVNEAAGGGTDTLDFSASTGAVTINLASDTLAALNLRTVMTGIAGQFINIENGIGGSAADLIYGNSVANTLIGNAGNDTITGGEGSDSLVGGANDDTYRFAAATAAQTDRVNEAAGGGTDTLDFSALATSVTVNLLSDTLATHTNRTVLTGVAGQFANIENAIGGSAGDSLTGNALANTLTGNAGNDTLTGGDGNDILIGGANNDLYKFNTTTLIQTDRIDEVAGGGTDTLDFSSLTTAVTANLLSDTLATHLNRTVLTRVAGQFVNIENVTGGSGADKLTGNNIANTLIGNAGNDTLTGNGGADNLQGGNDIDTFFSQDGAVDSLDGGLGIDILGSSDATDLKSNIP